MGIVGENGPEFAFSTGEGTVISPFAQARAALSGAAPATPMSVDNDMVGSASDTIYNSSSVSNAYAANRSSINNTSNRYQRNASEATYQEAVSAVMGSSGSVTIETQVINEVEYATVDQLRKSNEVTAQKTRAEVFAEMQGSVGLRKRIGI